MTRRKDTSRMFTLAPWFAAACGQRERLRANDQHPQPANRGYDLAKHEISEERQRSISKRRRGLNEAESAKESTRRYEMKNDRATRYPAKPAVIQTRERKNGRAAPAAYRACCRVGAFPSQGKYRRAAQTSPSESAESQVFKCVHAVPLMRCAHPLRRIWNGDRRRFLHTFARQFPPLRAQASGSPPLRDRGACAHPPPTIFRG